MTLLRRLLLFIPPFVLIFLEIKHPTGFSKDVFNQLFPQTNWWLTLHLLQLPLFALVGTSLFVLMHNLRTPAAWICRIAAWLFIVYYAAFDSVAGIGLGVLMRQVQGWSPEEQASIAQAAQLYFNDPLFGGIHSYLSQFASLTWLVAAWSAAAALYQAKKPVWTLVFLVLSGVLLWHSHAYPYGPLAFLCLLISYIGLEFSSRRVY